MARGTMLFCQRESVVAFVTRMVPSGFLASWMVASWPFVSWMLTPLCCG